MNSSQKLYIPTMMPVK